MSLGPDSAPLNLKAALTCWAPYLRRYGRAVTGSQSEGDEAVLKAVSALIAARTDLLASHDIRVKAFACLETELELGLEPGGQADEARSQRAALLACLEAFSPAQIGQIMKQDDQDQVEDWIKAGARLHAEQPTASILIIEDEALIAADLEAIVGGQGHQVCAIAATHSQVVTLFEQHCPDLILADIQLADGSSGIEAVAEILRLSKVPVIFITAFPERLLSGDRPEPVFVLNKPYPAAVIEAAVGQALITSRLKRHGS